jgi:hypothetical protein
VFIVANDFTDQQPAAAPEGPTDEIDPHAYLHLRMRVMGTQNKSLGKLEALDREAATGQLSALTIRHGVLGNRLTSVPISRVKWVNSDSVILDLTPAAFKLIPRQATS